MNIKSPNERAQHIAEMAYRHIYKPSEEGKRVEVLLDKMFLPQNAYCYAMFPKWFADSKLTPPTIEIVGFLGGAARFITKPCLKQRVMRFPTIRYGCSV